MTTEYLQSEFNYAAAVCGTRGATPWAAPRISRTTEFL